LVVEIDAMIVRRFVAQPSSPSAPFLFRLQVGRELAVHGCVHPYLLLYAGCHRLVHVPDLLVVPEFSCLG
jgi:hypothetical protein